MTGHDFPRGFRFDPKSPASDDTRLGTRQAAILDAVRADGAASVSELAARFGVTSQTIRRDLRALQFRGLLLKGFGGAFAAPGVAHRSYDERHVLQVAVKKRLVAALDEFLVAGATVFVGLGTTFHSLHEVAARHPGVLIATPNLQVAYTCALNSNATVYVYGGYVRNRDSSVLTLPDANRGRFKFDTAIIGASAIDEDGSVLEFDPMEVDLVRDILVHSRQIVLVAHDEKFRQRAPHQVTHIDDIDVLVTNGDPAGRFRSADALKQVRIVSVG